MAEWLVEEGIGEERAILVQNGAVIAARLHWPGTLAAGQVESAVLLARTAGSPRGSARFAGGEEALVDHLPRTASEGVAIRLEVTRAAIGESGRMKRAQARPTGKASRPAPSLAESLRTEGHEVRIVRRFAGPEWDELAAEAFAREVAFAGGVLHLSPTPAMTLIDVDGTPSPRQLALSAIPPIASAIRRFDLSGSIGIDFPTLPEKADRRAVDDALDTALAGWPHERTAMNGFGFIQIVARMERPSILHRLNANRTGAAARLLLRRAESVNEPGAILLTCHPAVTTQLQPAWLEGLTRRTGREIHLASDPALALESGFAQAVPS